MRLEDEKFGDIDSIGVRMPRGLKAKIKASAKENRHSMNAEIVKRLEASFDTQEGILFFEGLSAEQNRAVYNLIESLRK